MITVVPWQLTLYNFLSSGVTGLTGLELYKRDHQQLHYISMVLTSTVKVSGET